MLPNIFIAGQSYDVPQTKKMIETLHPDVVILDIQMPGGTGFDVLSSYKDKTARPIFIIFTNFSSDAYKKKCLAEGADYFFDKSKEFEQVINLLTLLS